MPSFGFKEKMLWAQFAGVALVVCFYARSLAHSGPGHHYFHAVVVGSVLLSAAVHAVTDWRSKYVLGDDRDREIAAIGTRWSNGSLWIGLVLMLITYWDGGLLRSANMLVGLLFHLLLLAAVIRIIRELVAYRRLA